MLLSGVFAIAPTPFADDGRVDTGSLDRLIAYYEETGVTGLTILGQMGEAPKLEPEESASIVARVLGRTGLPVVVGVSAPGFASMRRLAAASMDAGAAGVMIAPPSTLRTDDQIVAYYKNAAAAIGESVPVVVQDYPLTFSVVMSPAVIMRLVNEVPGVVALKHEDWPGLEKISALRASERAGTMRPISILCGNGGLFLDFELERGADGAMTGYCYPELLVSLVNLSGRGAREEAHDVFDAHLPLLRYEQQPGLGLAVRKYVMKERGLLTSDFQRSPAVPLSPTARAEVAFLRQRLESAQGGAFVKVLQ
ncbi:MAG TPA: dihydrodipicolinate synthase family protein [Trebonia sp.]|nr:dihydrodipicolinate synthase family protein [Trebonia sp.]